MKNKIIYICVAVLVLASGFYILNQDDKLLEYEMENNYLHQQIESNESLIQEQKETIDKLSEMLYNENMVDKEAIANTIKDTSHSIVEKKVVEITHYTHTGNPTASGVMPKANHTIACNFLPFGTRVRIGEEVFTVEDIGSALGNTVIDVFVDSEKEAIQRGRYTEEVEILGE